MPTVQSVSNKPQATQMGVVALHAQGMSKRKIAKHMGLSINTVLKILKVRPDDATQHSMSDHIVPKALQTVEKAIDSGNAHIAMRYLERTLLGDTKGPTYQFHGDVRLASVTQLLPAAPSSTTDGPMLTVSPMSTSPSEATGTEAAAKPPGSDINVSSHTNFSNFSTDQLLDELRRRGVQV